MKQKTNKTELLVERDVLSSLSISSVYQDLTLGTQKTSTEYTNKYQNRLSSQNKLALKATHDSITKPPNNY